MRIAALVLLATLAVPAYALASPAGGADLNDETRTVMLSPAECTFVWSRFGANANAPVTSDGWSRAAGLVSKACDFAGIEKTVAKKVKAKKDAGAADFPGPRVPRKLSKLAVMIIVDFLTPTEAHPVPLAQEQAYGGIRDELREVIAGRNPYAPTKP